MRKARRNHQKTSRFCIKTRPISLFLRGKYLVTIRKACLYYFMLCYYQKSVLFTRRTSYHYQKTFCYHTTSISLQENILLLGKNILLFHANVSSPWENNSVRQEKKENLIITREKKCIFFAIKTDVFKITHHGLIFNTPVCVAFNTISVVVHFHTKTWLKQINNIGMCCLYFCPYSYPKMLFVCITLHLWYLGDGLI